MKVSYSSLFLVVFFIGCACSAKITSTTPSTAKAVPAASHEAHTASHKTASHGKGAAGGSSTNRPPVSDDALDSALSDKRYLQRQLKCALNEGPCDPVGRRLKSLAPLVLRGACPQCTPQETKQIQKTLSHLQRNYPKEWSKVVRQYAGL